MPRCLFFPVTIFLFILQSLFLLCFPLPFPHSSVDIKGPLTVSLYLFLSRLLSFLFLFRFLIHLSPFRSHVPALFYFFSFSFIWEEPSPISVSASDTFFFSEVPSSSFLFSHAPFVLISQHKFRCQNSCVAGSVIISTTSLRTCHPCSSSRWLRLHSDLKMRSKFVLAFLC